MFPWNYLHHFSHCSCNMSQYVHLWMFFSISISIVGIHQSRSFYINLFFHFAAVPNKDKRWITKLIYWSKTIILITVSTLSPYSNNISIITANTFLWLSYSLLFGYTMNPESKSSISFLKATGLTCVTARHICTLKLRVMGIYKKFLHP